MAGRQEVGDRLASPPGIPTSRFWPSDHGKSDGRVNQLQEPGHIGHTGHSASSSFQTFGAHFHNLDYFRQQEAFFATLDAEEVNPQAKGAKGGYPWGSAGLSMAAKAMGSVWRSVAVPKDPMAPAPAPASFAMDAAIRVNSASVAKSAPAGASAAGTRGTAFHAVWCHERCHKHDAAMLRAQLQLIMSRFEGELICQKTAGKFKLWLDDHSVKPDAPSGRATPGSGSAGSGNQCGFYVLLSDWRQLKPCMDILAEEEAKQPAAVILLCEQKGFAKAQLWNESRPSTSFPLYFLQIQEDRWVAELEQIISHVKQPLLQAPWTGSMAMVGTPFYDAVREPLSTRFSL